MVTITANTYVPFEPRPDSPQLALRERLREGLARLEPAPDRLLHASLIGPLPPRSDVEDLLLHNVLDGAAIRLTATGVRFEHQSAEGPLWTYRYALAPLRADFAHWRAERPIAEWADVPIVPGAADRLLARTWWSLHRGEVGVSGELAPGTPFGVLLEVHVPSDARVTAGGLVKPLVDGVVCALQRHPIEQDPFTVASRIANVLPATDREVLEVLVDGDRAALGSAEPLRLTAQHVHWNPADSGCVAGQLLVRRGGASDGEWRLSGRVSGVRPLAAPGGRRRR